MAGYINQTDDENQEDQEYGFADYAAALGVMVLIL